MSVRPRVQLVNNFCTPQSYGAGWWLRFIIWLFNGSNRYFLLLENTQFNIIMVGHRLWSGFVLWWIVVARYRYVAQIIRSLCSANLFFMLLLSITLVFITTFIHFVLKHSFIHFVHSIITKIVGCGETMASGCKA